MVPEKPIGWSDHGSNGPMTLIGMREFQDLTVTGTAFYPRSAPSNASACVGNRADQMWRNGIILCVAANGKWVLSTSGPLLGGGYGSSDIVKEGAIPSFGTGDWHTLSLTTVAASARGSFDGKSLFSDVTIRDIDTGFSVIGASTWIPIEWKHFSMKEVKPNTLDQDVIPYRNALPNFVQGAAISAEKCERNGNIDPAQQFTLEADWSLKHSSGMCAEASSAAAGATLSLQPCVHGKTTQQFRNDYTRIRNGNFPISLGAYGVLRPGFSLVGSGFPNVAVTLTAGAPDEHELPPEAGAGTWNTWSYFPNTNQLRNQYTANLRLGYPLCLAAQPSRL